MCTIGCTKHIPKTINNQWGFLLIPCFCFLIVLSNIELVFINFQCYLLIDKRGKKKFMEIHSVLNKKRRRQKRVLEENANDHSLGMFCAINDEYIKRTLQFILLILHRYPQICHSFVFIIKTYIEIIKWFYRHSLDHDFTCQ